MSFLPEKQYVANVEQLDKIRQEWEGTYIHTCEMFQQQEEDRINILRNSMWVHANHLSSQCVQDDECYELIRTILEKCDPAEDNKGFVEMKSTGCTPPAPIVFQNYYDNENASEKLGCSRFGGVMKRFSGLIQHTGTAFKLQFSEPGTQTIAEISDGVYASISEGPEQEEENTEEFEVMYDYIAQNEDELSVCVGDTVLVMQRGEDGWWTVHSKGQTGLVPGSYLSPELNS